MFQQYWSAKRSTRERFLLGERSLRAYLAGGNVRFLNDAEINLSAIGPDAQQYSDAQFYLGVTKAQLRKAPESIEILSELLENVSSKKGAHSDFANRIALQLAYSHIKTYTENGFNSAKKLLEQLVSSANTNDSRDLLLQAQSLLAFLYAVMEEYSEQEQKKPDYAQQAREIGEKVINDPKSSQDVRFEALNALGITWMRVAENNWNGFGDRAKAWTQAEDYYNQALSIVPNSVRVLQNKATLRRLQVEQNLATDPVASLTEAKQLVQRSLEINDQDQFPFYQLARIAVAQKDKDGALVAIAEGRRRSGSVKEKSWTEVTSKAEAL